MNRPLTEVYSLRPGNDSNCRNKPDSSGCYDANCSIWQSETSHRYVLGVYSLQRRLIEAFPNVLLENCASGWNYCNFKLELSIESLILLMLSYLGCTLGGGRFDPGMLYYSPQIWCSDNTDAIARVT